MPIVVFPQGPRAPTPREGPTGGLAHVLCAGPLGPPACPLFGHPERDRASPAAARRHPTPTDSGCRGRHLRTRRWAAVRGRHRAPGHGSGRRVQALAGSTRSPPPGVESVSDPLGARPPGQIRCAAGRCRTGSGAEAFHHGGAEGATLPDRLGRCAGRIPADPPGCERVLGSSQPGPAPAPRDLTGPECVASSRAGRSQSREGRARFGRWCRTEGRKGRVADGARPDRGSSHRSGLGA